MNESYVRRNITIPPELNAEIEELKKLDSFIRLNLSKICSLAIQQAVKEVKEKYKKELEMPENNVKGFQTSEV